ncbi:hypothetical protein pb186bvf_000260 [Paramecium bursaria]
MRIIIAVLLVSIAFAQCPGGTFLYNGQQVNCTCTDVYTKRFGTTVATNGVGSIPINFNSTIGIDAQQNLVINISFVDNKTDPTTNLDNNFSCIKPVFNKYGVNFVGTPQVFTPTIVSSYNEQTGYRTWSYSISPANFQTQLIAGTNSTTLLNYAGYFGIDFTAVGIVQVTYQYSFTIQVNRATSATATTSFNQIINTQTAVCITSGGCITSTQTLLQFCTTADCATPASVINLALNQNYWLLLSITNNGFNQYLLRNPVLTLSSGSSLFRQYTPTAAQVNVAAGKTIISNTVDFAYQNVVIAVSAQLFPPGSRRILVDNTNTTSLSMTASSNSIDCIKYSNSQNCISCADQYITNKGIASPSCPLCTNSSSIMSIAFSLKYKYIDLLGTSLQPCLFQFYRIPPSTSFTQKTILIESKNLRDLVFDESQDSIPDFNNNFMNYCDTSTINSNQNISLSTFQRNILEFEKIIQKKKKLIKQNRLRRLNY